MEVRPSVFARATLTSPETCIDLSLNAANAKFNALICIKTPSCLL
jgi:hypothetical protein